jgi:hypothetical protein
MSYPLSTDKLGDAALHIKALAEWADARLPVLGLETLYTGVVSLNPPSDLGLTFARIRNPQCIITNVHWVTGETSGSGEAVWSLQFPVWGILSGSPSNMVWARGINGALQGNVVGSKAKVCAFGWGTPA